MFETLGWSNPNAAINASIEASFLGLKPVAPWWYAVHVRSNFERKVARSLESKSVDYFLPAVEEQHRWKDRKKNIAVPVFPGYVFVRIPDATEHRRRVLQTDGVIRILGQGGSIEPIPNNEVESVRLLLTSGLRVFDHPFLHEGARVRVRSGPLKDVEGIIIRFKNRDRLVLSVNLLAQSIAAEIDAVDAEAV